MYSPHRHSYLVVLDLSWPLEGLGDDCPRSGNANVKSIWYEDKSIIRESKAVINRYSAELSLSENSRTVPGKPPPTRFDQPSARGEKSLREDLGTLLACLVQIRRFVGNRQDMHPWSASFLGRTAWRRLGEHPQKPHRPSREDQRAGSQRWELRVVDYTTAGTVDWAEILGVGLAFARCCLMHHLSHGRQRPGRCHWVLVNPVSGWQTRPG